MSQVTLNVPDISCAHCERTILETLQGRPGVNEVRVDIPAKKVYLDYDENAINLQQVGDLLDEEGYAVVGVSEGAAPKEQPEPDKRSFIRLFSK